MTRAKSFSFQPAVLPAPLQPVLTIHLALVYSTLSRCGGPDAAHAPGCTFGSTSRHQHLILQVMVGVGGGEKGGWGGGQGPCSVCVSGGEVGGGARAGGEVCVCVRVSVEGASSPYPALLPTSPLPHGPGHLPRRPSYGATLRLSPLRSVRNVEVHAAAQRVNEHAAAAPSPTRFTPDAEELICGHRSIRCIGDWRFICSYKGPSAIGAGGNAPPPKLQSSPPSPALPLF